MAVIDRTYHNLLKEILNNGYKYEDPNRKGINRIQISDYKIKHDFRYGFPALTTKKLAWKSVVGELLWILRGDTNIKYLVDNNIPIWNKDQENFKNRFNEIEEGYVGKTYGHQLRNFNSVDVKRPQPKPAFNYHKELIKPDLSYKKAIYCGKRFSSKSDGDFVVISYTKNKGYNIQFLDNGGIRRGVNSSNIKTGDVKNPYKLNVKGIACIGKKKNIISNKNRRLIYQTWTNLLNRCYDKNHLSYENYGGKGVYVDNRWLCFEYFLDDVSKFENFNNKLCFPKNFQLDKDFKGDGFKYSNETCQWLNTSKNISGFKNEIYVLKNIQTNEIVKTDNLHRFCHDYNLGVNGTKIIYYLKSKKLDRYKNWILLDIEYKRNYHGIDQLSNLIHTLKTNPMATKKTVTFWNPAEAEDTALTPCHWSFEVLVEPLDIKSRTKLYCKKCNVGSTETPWNSVYDAVNIPKYQFTLKWHQHSVDTFLGLPFNIASYALLAEIIGKITNMVPKGIIGDLSNVHIYEPHLGAVKEQLTRYVSKYSKCELEFLDEFHYLTDKDLMGELSINDILDKTRIDMFKLKNYNSYPTIKAKMLAYDNDRS